MEYQQLCSSASVFDDSVPLMLCISSQNKKHPFYVLSLVDVLNRQREMLDYLSDV